MKFDKLSKLGKVNLTLVGALAMWMGFNALNDYVCSRTEKKVSEQMKASLSEILSPLSLRGKIILDAGHVGEPGKIGAAEEHGPWAVITGKYPLASFIDDTFTGEKNYGQEAVLIKPIADGLKDSIVRYSPNSNILITYDRGRTLSEKIKYVAKNAKPNDILISIHSDTSFGNDVKAFYSNSRTRNRNWTEIFGDFLIRGTLKNSKEEDTKNLANSVLAELEKLGFKNKGVMPAVPPYIHENDLGILTGPNTEKGQKGYPPAFKAILFEIGSVNNDLDKKYFRENGDLIVRAIYKGIQNYKPMR